MLRSRSSWVIGMLALGMVAVGVGGGCSSDKSPSNPGPVGPSGPRDGNREGVERIAVPGGSGSATTLSGGRPGALCTDDCTLTIKQPAPGPAGAAVVASVVLAATKGYEVNVSFEPMKLTMQPQAEVTVAKAVQTATEFKNVVGRRIDRETENIHADQIQYDVTLTAEKPGTYQVTGEFKFGICSEATCVPKKQEIAINLVAQ